MCSLPGLEGNAEEVSSVDGPPPRRPRLPSDLSWFHAVALMLLSQTEWLPRVAPALTHLLIQEFTKNPESPPQEQGCQENGHVGVRMTNTQNQHCRRPGGHSGDPHLALLGLGRFLVASKLRPATLGQLDRGEASQRDELARKQRQEEAV